MNSYLQNIYPNPKNNSFHQVSTANVLEKLLTSLTRPANLSKKIRPYIGLTKGLWLATSLSLIFLLVFKHKTEQTKTYNSGSPPTPSSNKPQHQDYRTFLGSGIPSKKTFTNAMVASLEPRKNPSKSTVPIMAAAGSLEDRIPRRGYDTWLITRVIVSPLKIGLDGGPLPNGRMFCWLKKMGPRSHHHWNQVSGMRTSSFRIPDSPKQGTNKYMASHSHLAAPKSPPSFHGALSWGPFFSRVKFDPIDFCPWP